jgi:hypothetical protein
MCAIDENPFLLLLNTESKVAGLWYIINIVNEENHVID